ncbi:hypothetical protein HanRHA438_Chr17g0834091 [Helianthus annuus]|nr:hypothetical protein HanIR_Chr17g0894711 [Helianthus annuus]KAJ0828166.1 hypothetical protein HanRHA438_Chr17g0834091 [Helianthus annuus]
MVFRILFKKNCSLNDLFVILKVIDLKNKTCFCFYPFLNTTKFAGRIETTGITTPENMTYRRIYQLRRKT